MISLIYAYVTTLLAPQGGLHHGHIIIMNPTLYTALSTTAWSNPPDPGVYPKIPQNATAAHQDQLQLQHDEVRIIYENMGKMDESVNNQAIDIVKDT